jgi:hypothetical protein
MQRGSDRLSPHRDDEMKHELEGLLRSGHPTRTEEWRDPEPAADDEPTAAAGRVSSGPLDGPALRLELARRLNRSDFPLNRHSLARALTAQHAPEPVIDLVQELPKDGTRYASVQQILQALGLEPQR